MSGRFRVDAWAALLALASCASEPDGTTGLAPCASTLAAACEQRCAGDGDCPAGLYCLTGRCFADCGPGARGCAAGTSCSPRGRCVATGDAAPAAPMGDACADIDVRLSRQSASVMLLIDQSGSMTNAFGGTTRWSAVRSALVDRTSGVLRALEGEVRFGLAMYTGHDGNRSGTCPILRPPISVALNRVDAIAAALNAASPDDDTPTAESVTAVAQMLRAIPPGEEPGAKVIVLATDGEPDTCAQPDPMTSGERDAARAGSVAAVRAAFRDGIRTYVISVGSDVSEAHLRDLAAAGAGTPSARFYRATDPAALTAAFREITTGVRSCVFRLNGRVTDAAAGDVRLDGAALTLGATDGWSLRSPTEIELRGAACARARSTSSSLTARFPCGVVTPG